MAPYGSDDHGDDRSPGTGATDGERSSYASNGFPGTGAGPGPEGLRLCPWERRQEFGFLNAIYLTTREVLTAPGRFFSRMPTRIGLAQPLLYALVLGITAALLGWLWSLAGSSLRALTSGDILAGVLGPVPSFLRFVASPLLVTLDVFVRAALMHLMLMLLGGNQLGFEASFRVAAYGKAAGIILLVPFCGTVVAVLAELAINIVGLHRIHGTDPWRALVAVIGPATICLSSVVAIIFLIIMGSGLS